MHKLLILMSLSALSGTAVSAAPTTAPARPNVVIIVADDMGFADVGFNGCTDIKTPNLDRLAASGVRLDQFYVQPVCSPTRAALMTGRYPMRHGLQVGRRPAVGAVRAAARGAHARAGPEGRGLRDGHHGQVAPRALPARVSSRRAAGSITSTGTTTGRSTTSNTRATAGSTGTATTRSTATRGTRRT